MKPQIEIVEPEHVPTLIGLGVAPGGRILQTYQGLPAVSRAPAPTYAELESELELMRERADRAERRVQDEIRYTARLIIALRDAGIEPSEVAP